MGPPPKDRRASPLLLQLHWFVRLRWLAGATVILVAFANGQWLHWYPLTGHLAGVGVIILAYNAMLYGLMRRATPREGLKERPSAVWLATASWAQVMLDLGCLTFLTLWTGGAHSPLLGFYVFHMVFASLLLPRHMSYGAATAALLLLAGGLGATRELPRDLYDWLTLAGWAVTLWLTVYLTNRITKSLRRQHRRVVQQKKRILHMGRRLRRQQQTMIQHEKMVAVGQMAAGVAHEIANPLASMDSLLELMQRHPERDRPDRVASLREQARRIQQIVHQMTTFAHPGEALGQPKGVNEVIETALAMMQFDARLKKVRVEKQLAPEAGSLRIESRSVEQVLVNLMMNALDAMEGQPEPRLEIRSARDGKGWLIEVADNGHGIAQEHLERLFEPFFTTKPVGKGTGLGLAISYSLIRKLGGHIDVRSEKGRGATFTIHLPAPA